MTDKKADKALEAFCKAMSHKTRRTILGHFRSAMSKAQEVAVENQTKVTRPLLSPVLLNDLLPESLGNLSYHVKVLEKLGFLKLKKEEPRRGAVEHLYELPKGKEEELLQHEAVHAPMPPVLSEEERAGLPAATAA